MFNFVSIIDNNNKPPARFLDFTNYEWHQDLM